MMAIYVGQDKKGKEKREFELINNITAANFYRRSNDKTPTDNQLVPIKSKSGFELRYKLKIGTMVLLYENNPEEVWELDRKNLQKRLYKVTGMRKELPGLKGFSATNLKNMRIFFEEWRMLESYNSSAPTDEFTEINKEASVRTDEMPLNSAVQTAELQVEEENMSFKTMTALWAWLPIRHLLIWMND